MKPHNKFHAAVFYTFSCLVYFYCNYLIFTELSFLKLALSFKGSFFLSSTKRKKNKKFKYFIVIITE